MYNDHTGDIFHNSPATYVSHRECVGLFLHRRRDKGALLKKGGPDPGPPPPPDPPMPGV